ncbi:hypothetical protein [Acinetobacter sp. YH01020]|uniref:Bbp19 family protein n=1 Tax=Acinetobacter sp. YH01020 TaxID=2601034 RepID=UPI0015D3F11C|nr:hypothetical protein [Acinetobacter sp. YH01020]
MILIIAVLAILLLIVSVLLWSVWNERNMLTQQLSDELAAKAKLNQADQSEAETGTLIKRRYYRPVTAETYRNLFDIDANGMRVLEHLTSIFCKSTYVRGGHEADRESCFRAGQSEVIQFILKQINRANDPNYKEEVND